MGGYLTIAWRVGSEWNSSKIAGPNDSKDCEEEEEYEEE
jgi:hypothetical protein